VLYHGPSKNQFSAGLVTSTTPALTRQLLCQSASGSSGRAQSVTGAAQSRMAQN